MRALVVKKMSWQACEAFHRGSCPSRDQEDLVIGELRFLRSRLGEAFFARYPRHPLIPLLINPAETTRQKLLRVTSNIRLLERSANPNELWRRVRDRHEYGSILAEIETAAALTVAGFRTQFIEETPKWRQPDLVVWSKNQPILIEIASLGTSEEDAMSINHFRAASEPLFGMRPGPRHSSPRELRDRMESRPVADLHRETYRTVRKVWEKSRQIPPDGTGLVVLFQPQLASQLGSVRASRAATRQILRLGKRMPQVGHVIIVATMDVALRPAGRTVKIEGGILGYVLDGWGVPGSVLAVANESGCHGKTEEVASAILHQKRL